MSDADAEENKVVRIHPEFKSEETVEQIKKTPEIVASIEADIDSLKAQMVAAQENLTRMQAQMAELEARLQIEKAA